MKFTERTKEFERLFNQMAYRQGLFRKSAWSDLMQAFACSINNIHEPYEKRREEREKMYEDAIQRLGGEEIPSRLFALLMEEFAENPVQDFLGEMYMRLSMGEKGWGQCFTPYHVCDLMARMIFNNPKEVIKEKGYVSTLDPTVGGGAMLIAGADIARNAGLNPSTEYLAVGQDIDLTAVHMAYIQLSLIGVPAVIIRGNTLSEPYTGNPMFIEDNENYWYTPMLYSSVWSKRREKYIKEAQKEQRKSA